MRNLKIQEQAPSKVFLVTFSLIVLGTIVTYQKLGTFAAVGVFLFATILTVESLKRLSSNVVTDELTLKNSEQKLLKEISDYVSEAEVKIEEGTYAPELLAACEHGQMAVLARLHTLKLYRESVITLKKKLNLRNAYSVNAKKISNLIDRYNKCGNILKTVYAESLTLSSTA